jgi:phage gp29-like protein
MRPFTGILDPSGRVVSAERVRLDKQTRFNPLADWTPDVLTRQLSAWARGDIKELAWVMEWLETHDDTISAVAPKAKSAVSRHGFDTVLVDEIPEGLEQLAEDQRGVLRNFYDAIEARHAIDLDMEGGFRLLVSQVMDGHGKGYATHHLVWKRTAAGLRLETVQVPLWFWEATEGALRFLPGIGASRGIDRNELGGPSAWMVARGRGVMTACAIARMFKQIPLQDWLTYCDRHGMPAFVGKTAAAKGSSGWNDLYDAVTNIGSEFGAVMNTGDSIDVLNLTSQGELPYEKLVDRMDRACVLLWRGGDLGTLSRDSGVGANPQGEETDDLDADNAAWVSETLDRNLSRRVLDYHFGSGVPQLAKLVLRTKTRENITQDLAVLQAFKGMGERVSRSWAAGKFNVVLADQGDEALGDTAAPPATVRAAPAAPVDARNISADYRALLETSLAKAVGVRTAVLAPIQPVIDRLAAASRDARMDDAAFLQLVEEAAESLPELFDPAQAAELADELEAALGTAVLQGTRDALRENAETLKTES